MARTIELPHVGESVVEGTIGKWLKQPGDQIERYEPLVEVITDKVTMEVPSPVDGYLVKILAQEGETIPMGAPIAEVETAEEATAVSPAPSTYPEPGAGQPPGGSTSSPRAGEEQSSTARPEPVESLSAQPAAARPEPVGGPTTPSAAVIGYLNTSATMVGPTGGGSGDNSSPDAPPESPTPMTQVATQPAATLAPIAPATAASAVNGSPRLSPAVRRLAREHNIDLARIPGTGMGGRITRDDVLQYLESSLESGAAPTAATATTTTTATAEPAIAPETAPQPAAGADEEYVTLTPVRRMIAAAMVRSVTEIPHAWSAVEVDVTNLVAARAAMRESFRQREGVDLTYLPFVLRVLVESLKENPTFNASWGGDKIILKRRLNVGLAVAAPAGLVVPVIHDADRLSLSGLAHAVADLAQRARQNKLTLPDVQGGTFTLNNTGALGSTVSMPIINHPQAAIMTTEAVQKRPVVINDAIAIRSMMNLCLSFDHRINDGAESSAFIQSIKRRLESIGPDSVQG